MLNAKVKTKRRKRIFMPFTDDIIFKEGLSNVNNRDCLIKYLEVVTKLPKYILSNDFSVKYESILEKSRYKDKSLRGDILVYFDKYIVNLECYSSFTDYSFDKSASYLMRVFVGST